MKKNRQNILYYGGGFAALTVILLPSVTHAMVFKDLVNFILINIIERTIVPFLISLSVLAFLWGVLQYVRKGAGSEKAIEQGRNMMFYGLIGLAAIVSVWGLVRMVAYTFFTGMNPTEQIDSDIRDTERWDMFERGV